MSRTWMRAADEPTIPTAFIVDQTGRIAWIGNSLEIEDPLRKVLDGTWDLAAAKVANHKRVQINQLQRQFDKYVSARDWANVASAGAELEKLDSSRVYEAGPWRFQALLELGRENEAYALARRLVDGPFKDEALRLNWIAWIVVDPEAARSAPRNLDFALEVAQRADALTGHSNAPILDTLAVCYFESGDVAKAIEVQERAVQAAANTKWLKELEQRLARFRDAANRRSENEKLAVK
jgi:tetratricopeptide (TPR) repeat protein